jgi:pimeloyl-ACP methyl ester carboxylesterase
MNTPSSPPTPTLIFIHGIGSQDDDWLDSAILNLSADARARSVAFTWSDILDDSTHTENTLMVANAVEGMLKRQTAQQTDARQAAIYVGVILIALPLVKHFLGLAADVLGYPSVRYTAFQRLDHLIQEQAGEVILIGHSLGSVLAFEYLTLGVNPLVKGFISLGSPLDRQPIKGKVLDRVKGRKSLHTPWLNIWGSHLLLATVAIRRA